MFACSQDKYPRGVLPSSISTKESSAGTVNLFLTVTESIQTRLMDERNRTIYYIHIYIHKSTTERITKASTYPRGDDNSSTKPRHAPLPTFAFRRSRVTVRDNRRGIFRGRIILRWGGDCSTIFPPLYSPTLRISLGSIPSSFERGGYWKRNHYLFSEFSEWLQLVSL